METTLIRNIQKIPGLTKIEFVKRVKAALGVDTLNPALNFVEQLELCGFSGIQIDSKIIPHLRNCFTFEIVSEKEKEEREFYLQRERQMKSANEWFETLSEEQKEFVYLLGRPSAY